MQAMRQGRAVLQGVAGEIGIDAEQFSGGQGGGGVELVVGAGQRQVDIMEVRGWVPFDGGGGECGPGGK